MLHIPTQSPGAPVLVGRWQQDEDFPVFPVGSKPKRMLICPDDATEPYLIKGHAYLFKTAIGWQAQQIWSEVIAYRLGALIGLPVPPAFIAVDERTGDTGVLVEFFYGYPGETEPARLIHGSDLMTRILADKKRGRPHVVPRNIIICRAFVGQESAVEWWAQALAFDALIGNTDRHPENWGFLIRHSKIAPPTFQIAPLFDNGTSLGYELPEAKLEAIIEGNRLNTYIKRGTHHCGWDLRNDRPEHHFDLCTRFLTTYRETSVQIENVIRFDMAQVEAILNECARFEVGVPFTSRRAKFVAALINARRDLLQRLLAESND
ncbi:MAG TPA: HipA domain-containing protein [Microvirga sp.]|nr:HipA domain-containing protein [Microvirga sp.]